MTAKISLGPCLRRHHILDQDLVNSCQCIQGSYSWNDDFQTLSISLQEKKLMNWKSFRENWCKFLCSWKDFTEKEVLKMAK